PPSPGTSTLSLHDALPIWRAAGGFGLTMTCASHVQAAGKGFSGQLGIWSDMHLPGLERLARGINATGSRSAVQLHHAGLRSPRADRKSTRLNSSHVKISYA